MSKNVVLFLTSPNSPIRTKIILENFKQLEKLGYDIITLTTTDLLPDYVLEKSKHVIYDYNDHKCYKKDYYEFYKKTKGFGYYFYDININHAVKFFQDTHFPSLLRNTRTLIHFAESFCYEKYFFVEDDHFFHDDDLYKINIFFNFLSENDGIFFSFKNTKLSENILQDVDMSYFTYFHFGDVKKNNLLFKNFAYTREHFLENDEIYLNFYETVFNTLINRYKTEDYRIKEVSNLIEEVFPKSKLNKFYSFLNLEDDSRCNIVIDTKDNCKKFYYTSIGLTENVNIKLYFENELFFEKNLQPGWWYVLPIEDKNINKLSVVLNNVVKKRFNNLELEKIVYNGEFIQQPY